MWKWSSFRSFIIKSMQNKISFRLGKGVISFCFDKISRPFSKFISTMFLFSKLGVVHYIFFRQTKNITGAQNYSYQNSNAIPTIFVWRKHGYINYFNKIC